MRTARTEQGSPTPRRIGALVVGAVTVIVASLLITFGFIEGSRIDHTAVAGTDLEGNEVTLEEDSGLTPEIVQQMDAQDDTGERFAVPSVGLDVPLGVLSMASNNITPPGFASAYTIRNLGVLPADADKGTVFVAMHSLRGGAVGPGNYLIDVENQSVTVAPGTLIEVAGVTYAVTGSQAIDKTRISEESAVWENVPNRLVVITCLQLAEGGPSVENIVITAERVGTEDPPQT